MLPVGFEPKISAGERPQTYALGRAATGTGTILTLMATIGTHLKTDKSRIFYTSTELQWYLNKLLNQTYSFLEKERTWLQNVTQNAFWEHHT